MGLNAAGAAPQRATRSRHTVRWILIGVAIAVLVAVGGAAYSFFLTHTLRRTEVRGLSRALTSGQEAETENILMAGSTSRCALAEQNPAYGLCSQGVNGVNSDVIMILHVDTGHHRLALLSIPRDLFVPNARSDGANKIDAGLYEGLSQLVAAIEEDFGIPIQHAVSLNFDQFANVVNAVGGINMAFPMSVFDAESGLNVQAASCVHLDGRQALAVVRARHLQYDAPGSGSYATYWPEETQSDLARIRRDHEFLRVLASSAVKIGLGNPITDVNLVNSVKADFTFDQSWSVNDMARLLRDFHSVNVNTIPQLTLPVAAVTDPAGYGGQLIYEGGAYGDAEFPAQPQDRAVIDQVLGIGPGTDSLTGTALPSASDVTVSVVNGTGSYNQGSTTATALGALGFQTVGISDSAPVGDVAETVVYYGSRSPAAEAAAETVADSLSGAVITAYDPTHVIDGADVTVVTGTQFTVNPAPPGTASGPSGPAPAAPGGTPPGGTPPGGPASAPTPTSTSTTTTTAPATDIAPPSEATSSLQPWDPRACPAGASPTAPVPNQVG